MKMACYRQFHTPIKFTIKLHVHVTTLVTSTDCMLIVTKNPVELASQNLLWARVVARENDSALKALALKYNHTPPLCVCNISGKSLFSISIADS